MSFLIIFHKSMGPAELQDMRGVLGKVLPQNTHESVCQEMVSFPGCTDRGPFGLRNCQTSSKSITRLGRNLESASNSKPGTEVCSNRKRHHNSLILLKHLLHTAGTSAKAFPACEVPRPSTPRSSPFKFTCDTRAGPSEEP